MTVLPSNTTPLTMEQLLQVRRLERKGIERPNFATLEETLAWLEKHKDLARDPDA